MNVSQTRLTLPFPENSNFPGYPFPTETRHTQAMAAPIVHRQPFSSGSRPYLSPGLTLLHPSLHTAALELPDYTNNQRVDLAITIVYLWPWTPYVDWEQSTCDFQGEKGNCANHKRVVRYCLLYELASGCGERFN